MPLLYNKHLLSPRIVSNIVSVRMNWQITASFIPPLVLPTLRSFQKSQWLQAVQGWRSDQPVPCCTRAAIPVPITPVPWLSRGAGGRRRATADSPSGAWTRRQRVLQQRSLHGAHVSIALGFTSEVQPPNSACFPQEPRSNATRIHRGLNTSKKHPTSLQGGGVWN